MKHLFCALVYILLLTSSDHGLRVVAAVPALLVIVVLLRRITNAKLSTSPPTPSSITVGPKTSCVLTTPTGGQVEDVTNTMAAAAIPLVNGTADAAGSAPRRQRSLRERAGIDGRLDKLHQPTTVLPNHSTYLAPSPSVSAFVNAEFNRPVRKSDFAEHVRFMSQDSDQRFIEEYQDLSKVGKGQPCTAADMPYNRGKNRFANILPYDHSRVKLNAIDGCDGSDYINASYVPGYNGRKEFISTQGPLATTRDDFWRMVWEQNSTAIVNLTRCHEKGREKCDQYWPNDHESVQFGNIRVSLVKETPIPYGTIRELNLDHNDQTRLVTHFHFTAWPDFGVPERPQTLVKFIRTFRAHVPPAPHSDGMSPVIVHCSAGVGRSGTLMAVDRILQHMESDEYVDVYGVVYEMRKERFWMVQTEQQYIFIHRCLLCVLDGHEEDENSNQGSPVVDLLHGPPFA